ncbi:MAG: isochorismate synthase [Planctomycetota bacterium]
MAQSGSVKMYWSSRDVHLKVAGLGLADRVDSQRTSSPAQALGKIEKNLANASAGIRYYGGLCFDMTDSTAAAWEGLGNYCFFVPEFELRQESNQTVFLFNIMVTEQDTVNSITQQFLESFDNLSFDTHKARRIPDHEFSLPSVLKRSDRPDQSSWQDQTQELIGHIQANRVKKIVQTRITSLELVTAPDPLRLLHCVKNRSINTYDFCFQIDTDHAFIGCSPECLYQKAGNRIFRKEAEEHEYVFENIKSELENICEEVTIVNKREILSLEYVQHLRSRFEGTLKKGIGDRDILCALHPTAAVNGYPKKAALALIREYEHFSRGWYAGPVGWIDLARSEFAVAIRSAHITGQQIRMFAGAGIVSASDPSREWEETEMKMAPFLSLFEPSLKS